MAVHGLGALTLLAACAIALATGAVSLDPIAAWYAAADDPSHVILVGARMPRVLVAALVGGALGLAGAALQALLRNPLACPHVLGISGGAALAAIAAMIVLPPTAAVVATLGTTGALAVVPGAAFLGAILTAILVQVVAASAGRVSPYTLLLTGVVFNAIAGAIIGFLHTVADFYKASGILSWVVGAIAVRGWGWTTIAGLTLLAGLVLLLSAARDLNALAIGEEGAAGLGVQVDRLRARVYAAVCLLVAGAVPISGMIGFVGLIVPHAVRLAVGADLRLVLPGALWGGAAFLVAADTLARTAFAPTEIPVGIVTALSGGPFFLYLLYRQGRRAAEVVR